MTTEFNKGQQDRLRDKPTAENGLGRLSRAAGLRNYVAQKGLKARPELEICAPETVGTAVIPAFNEAKGIIATLQTLESAGGLEAVVVDNNSTDRTPDVVKDFAQASPMRVALLRCPQQGYGPTRLKGLNQVVANYVDRYPEAEHPRFIIIMDADALLVPEWIEHHRKLISDPLMGAIGVTYRFPESADQQIEEVSGIPHYLFSLARLSNRLTAEGIAKIQTGTKGSAIEVGAYAAIGGAKLVANDATGVSAEDRVMGDQVRVQGMKVGFNPALNIHDARRVSYEIANRIAALQTYDVDPAEMRTRQLATRPEDIREAMRRLTKEEWRVYHRQRLESFVRRNITAPIANGEISPIPLYNFLTEIDIQPESIGGDIGKLTDIFIRTDELLSPIYSF